VGLQVRCVLAALGGQPVSEGVFWHALPSLLVSSLIPVSALGFSTREAALPWIFGNVTVAAHGEALWVAAAGLLTLTSWLALAPLLIWGFAALLQRLKRFWQSTTGRGA